MDDQSKKHIRNLLEILGRFNPSDVERQIIVEAQRAIGVSEVHNLTAILQIVCLHKLDDAAERTKFHTALARLTEIALRNADPDFLEVEAHNRAVKEGAEKERDAIVTIILGMISKAERDKARDQPVGPLLRIVIESIGGDARRGKEDWHQAIYKEGREAERRDVLAVLTDPGHDASVGEYRLWRALARRKIAAGEHVGAGA